MSDRMKCSCSNIIRKNISYALKKITKRKEKCHDKSTQIEWICLGILAELLPTLKWEHNVGKK